MTMHRDYFRGVFLSNMPDFLHGWLALPCKQGHITVVTLELRRVRRAIAVGQESLNLCDLPAFVFALSLWRFAQAGDPQWRAAFFEGRLLCRARPDWFRRVQHVVAERDCTASPRARGLAQGAATRGAGRLSRAVSLSVPMAYRGRLGERLGQASAFRRALRQPVFAIIRAVR